VRTLRAKRFKFTRKVRFFRSILKVPHPIAIGFPTRWISTGKRNVSKQFRRDTPSAHPYKPCAEPMPLVCPSNAPSSVSSATRLHPDPACGKGPLHVSCLFADRITHTTFLFLAPDEGVQPDSYRVIHLVPTALDQGHYGLDSYRDPLDSRNDSGFGNVK
jgi:hypothetical protein